MIFSGKLSDPAIIYRPKVEKGSMSYVQQKTFLLFISFFLFFFSFFSCEKSTAPVNNPRVTLTAEYVGVTDAELILQTRNIEPNTQYQLFRDDSLVNRGTLSQGDTTIIDTLLLPAYSYSYKAQLIKDGDPVAYSQPLQITTMDTTSHQYQWETFSFGGLGSSLLFDVAIINESDIWAVGEIYADTTQPWSPYNAIHWNGQEWELKRITYGGSPWPIHTIWAFSSNDIWFDAFVRWNGNMFIEMSIPNVLIGFGINKIWGSPHGELFIVGNQGKIAYSPNKGNSWQKLESGTETQINDIWGATDFSSLKKHVLAVVSDEYHLGDMRILSVHPNGVRDTLNWNFNRRVMSVWFKDHTGIYVCGSGVRVYQHGKWKLLDLTNNFTLRVRGSAPNNIFIVGAYGSVLHYNGYSWHTYPELILSNGKLLGLAVTDNLVVAVGYTDYRGFILTGKKF
jgi:hypothetical protein